MQELIWLIIGLLSAYVLFELYRAFFPNVRAKVDALEGSEGAAGKDAIPDAADEEVFVFEPVSQMPREVEPGGNDFHLALDAQHMRNEVERLRAELGEQQATVAALRDTIRNLQEQIEAAIGGPGTSPEYNEALVCARRGLDVGAIAERCGISVAEAELVKALSQQGEAKRGDGA